LYFCATKLEAFGVEVKGDYLSSHDLEELISVVDGRLELVDEMQVAPEKSRLHPLSKSRTCSTSDLLVDALPALPSSGCADHHSPAVTTLMDA